MSAAAAFAASRKSRIGGYGGYRRSSYQDSDDDGPNMCWVVLIGVCGIALLGSGAWYAYDSFDDPRLVAIKPYNEAVDAWNNQKRSVFADSVFEWRLVSPLPEPVTIEGADGQTNTVDRFKEVDPKSPEAKAVPWTGMAQVKVVEPLAHDQSLEGIHTYEPLRWVGSGVLPAAPPGHLEEQDGVIKWSGAEYQLQLRATTKSGKSSVCNVEPIVRRHLAFSMEEWLTGRLEELGCDGAVFAPYLLAVLADADHSRYGVLCMCCCKSAPRRGTHSAHADGL